MKKIFTLMFAASLATGVFAQPHHGTDDNYEQRRSGNYNDSRDNKPGRSYNHHNGSQFRERDMQIARINREYDNRILNVKSRSFMSWSKKSQMIDRLNDQRRNEIRKLYSRSDDRRNDRRGRNSNDCR